MSENFDDVFDGENNAKPDDGNDSQGPAKLREAYERQKAKAAELEKQIAEMQAERRQSTVKQFIAEKGLDEKVADLIGDKDPAEWFESYGALFGAAKPAEAPAPEDSVPQTPTGTAALTPEQLAAIQAVNSVQPGAFNPSGDGELASKADSIISASIENEEEMLRQLAQLR